MQDPLVPFFWNALHVSLSISVEAALLILFNRNLEMKSDGEEHLGSQTHKEAGAWADTRKKLHLELESMVGNGVVCLLAFL